MDPLLAGPGVSSSGAGAGTSSPGNAAGYARRAEHTNPANRHPPGGHAADKTTGTTNRSFGASATPNRVTKPQFPAAPPDFPYNGPYFSPIPSLRASSLNHGGVLSASTSSAHTTRFQKMLRYFDEHNSDPCNFDVPDFTSPNVVPGRHDSTIVAGRRAMARASLQQCFVLENFFVRIKPLIKFLSCSLYQDSPDLLEMLFRLVLCYIQESFAQWYAWEQRGAAEPGIGAPEPPRFHYPVGPTSEKYSVVEKFLAGVLLPAFSMVTNPSEKLVHLVWSVLYALRGHGRWRVYGLWEAAYDCIGPLKLVRLIFCEKFYL